MKEQPKLIWLIEKLKDLGDEKMVIFCRYTLEIDLISEALKTLKYNHVVMKGGMKEQEVSKIRKRFQADKKCQVLIGQIASVKEGNNFQKMCRYGVFYSKSLSYVDIEQCKRRLYRNGQKKKVIFYHLILRNTIDEPIETIIRSKFINAENVLLELMINKKKESNMAAKKKATKEKTEKKLPGGERPEFGVEALAQELGIDARATRLKLRAAKVEKEGKYYDFKNATGVKKVAKELSKEDK